MLYTMCKQTKPNEAHMQMSYSNKISLVVNTALSDLYNNNNNKNINLFRRGKKKTKACRRLHFLLFLLTC